MHHRAKLRKIKNQVKGKVKSKAKILLVWLVLFLSFGPHQVLAQVITPAADGTGTIVNVNSDPNLINITGGTQSGANLFHSFQKFGLNQGQIANFLSNPNIQNILGRVTGGDASVINGLIQVTGGNSNLYLMNPAGIIFGQNASLNVPAAFTATTANGIGFGDNQWFSAVGNNNYGQLTGNPSSFAFTSNQLGNIINAGDLGVKPGQSLTLLGGTVVNTGTISAPGGDITIAAVPGEKLVRISSKGSLLSLDLPAEVRPAVNTPTNSPLSLPALLTGSNTVDATGMTVEDGTVMLTSSGTAISSDKGTNIVSGKVSVGAGNINILGEKVALIAAKIDASATNGGGKVLVGGDYQGEGTVPNAKHTVVTSDSVINADATEKGDGGKVIVWADNTTRFAGNITARGGAQGGNGGLVETSGKNTLDVTGGKVDASATNGQAGTWLLDPTDINIINGGTGSLSGGLFDPPDNSTSDISPATIESALDGGTNVTITTASGSGGNGDIILTDSINQVGNGNASLTLTGRYLWLANNTANINMTSTGGLTFNLNYVNPVVNTDTTSINNAIAAIGNVAGNSTINLGAGTYAGSTVNVTKNLTINGDGAGSTRVSGNNANLVFNIAPGITAALQNLTISNGVSNLGGGINNAGNLTVANSAISGNRRIGYGGGIANSGTLNLLNSTISGNTADGGGGAISNGGTLTIENSTISGNRAFGDGGGGIYNTGNATVASSTIANNTPGSSRSGGGIFNASTLILHNSIVAGNNGTSPNILGTVNAASSYNIIGNSTGMSGISNGNNGNQIGVDPRLAPLGNYGGPTQTHALLADSPAIEAGDPNSTLSIDQRGGQRFSPIDIGAYEATSFYLVTNNRDDNTLGSLRSGVNFANLNTNQTQTNPTNTIRFDTNGVFANPQTITLTRGSLNLTAGNTTIDGTGASRLAIRGNNASRVFEIASGVTATLQNMTIADGNSFNGSGGGITNSGTLTVNNSAISNNNALYDGGGIFNSGNLTINNSTISDNTAQWGAGIMNYDGGTLVVNTSTIGANTAQNEGGGIYNRNNSNTLTINTSTISQNSAGVGGGVVNFSSTPFWLSNSIVADNQSTNVGYYSPDIAGLVDANSTYNLIGDGTNMQGISDGSNGNQVGVILLPIDPLLAPLDYYGNQTKTYALLPGSPAINVGNPNITTADQRGIAPVGVRDIGAFESRGFTITSSSNSNQSIVVDNTFNYPLTIASNYGEPVAGGIVTYTVSPGSTGAGATLSDNTATIDSSGNFNIAGQANTIAGSYILSAAINGTENPVTFNLTNNADIPSTITPTLGNNQTTIVNTNYASNLQALVKDRHGNVVPNASITFTTPTSGASATTTLSSITTDSNGQVSIPVKANTIAGAYQVTLGAGATSINFNLSSTPDVPATITPTGGNNQSTNTNTNFASNLQAIVKDQYGNVIPNANITFSAPNSGASATTTISSIATNTNGQVSLPVRANAIAGGYQVTLGSGTASIQFNLTNTSTSTNSGTQTTSTNNSGTQTTNTNNSGTQTTNTKKSSSSTTFFEENQTRLQRNRQDETVDTKTEKSEEASPALCVAPSQSNQSQGEYPQLAICKDI